MFAVMRARLRRDMARGLRFSESIVWLMILHDPWESKTIKRMVFRVPERDFPLLHYRKV